MYRFSCRGACCSRLDSLTFLTSQGESIVKYKINIHAHSIFSDGINSPYVMALKAKELGFSALVVTDHYYGHDRHELSLSINRMRMLEKASKEAKLILPVIIGMEIPLLGQEFLLFGGSAIKSILKNGRPTRRAMRQLQESTYCALIMCHPGDFGHAAADIADGFEEWNSGQNMFDNGRGKTRSFGKMENKPRWCNSDAHSADMLDWNYNIVDTKIRTESDLIKYIKRGKQPEFYINDRLS
jgi:predicted metal-dependent phosphoesterase TrpH